MRLLLTFLATLCIVPLLACTTQVDVEKETASPETVGTRFAGTWQFVHLETPDGLSTTQRGHMVVSGDYVCFVRVNRERETISQEDSDEVKARKAAALYNAVKATCGSYSVQGNTLTANWLTSADPSVEGNLTEFVLSEEGDRLSLSPAASPQYKFVYQRVD